MLFGVVRAQSKDIHYRTSVSFMYSAHGATVIHYI